VDLRHQHRVGLRLGDRVEIVEPPFRVEAVDAHDHLAGAEPAGDDGIRHLLAGGRLAVGRHRILEIEDDGVGRQAACFLDRAGVRSRHVEHAPARTDGHGDVSRWTRHQASIIAFAAFCTNAMTKVQDPCQPREPSPGMRLARREQGSSIMPSGPP
jgi:hypothetical protein